MAFPYSPVTHSDGQNWTAAKANALENAIRDGQLRPAVRVYHNANQNVLTATLTAFAFNSERFDTFAGSADTQHDTSTNNNRLTCKYAGKYLIIAQVSWPYNTTGYRALYIRLNGTTTISASQVMATNEATNPSPVMVISTIYDLAVNDYVEMLGYQTSGSTLAVLSSSGYSPEFMWSHVA